MLLMAIEACLTDILSIQIYYVCVYNVLLEQRYIGYGRVNSSVPALKVLFGD